MLVLAIELVFMLLFGHALLSWLRGRDPLASDVTLVFGAISGLFALTVLRVVLGDPPTLLRSVSVAMLLAQPVLVLRLVARVQDLPRALLSAAVVLYLVSAGPVIVLGSSAPEWSTWLAVGGFAVVQGVASLYLLREAHRRTGAPRLRLNIASLSTALFGLALVAAGSGAGNVAQIVALMSAVGYVAAFMPPQRLRRVWAMSAAHDYGRSLLAAPTDSTAEEIWERFARAIDEICDVDAVVVLARTPDGGVAVVASAGADQTTWVRHVDFDLLNGLSRQQRTNSACPIETTFAEQVQARYSTRVPLPPRHGGATDHVALLLSRHRSLFSDDDLDVVGDLGAQAGLLAGRADAAAEQQRLAVELANTVEALGLASQAKSSLLARVGHEFRTPLTVVIGYCAILRRTQGAVASSLATDAVDRIDEAGRRLLALVEEVLDVAKMDAGQLDLEPERVDVSDLVSRTIEELGPLAARKRLTISSHLTSTWVDADPGRLLQVLHNLFSNAIKFTPEGGCVRFVVEALSGEARISVVDTGVGIAAADQSRVFDEFTQLTVEPSNPGTGLGLSIARRLVTAHGGRTEVESAPGEGSRFTVVLPASS
ncbi:MAG TPA: HAMP domain-containing sensor histidine kinase [Nocardioidaceae bacterium]|nr:HAMP domain-containing sensor histidine kinase [Nocardioidaceae bacterium]